VIDTLTAWGIKTSEINGADNVVDVGKYAPTASGFKYVVEDSVVNGYVGPNYGGQRYDLEAPGQTH
jgi:hypothetical protein